MKWLAAFFSLITVLMLFNSLPQSNVINSESKNEFSAPSKIMPLKKVPELKAEKDWLAYTKQPEKAEVPTPKVELKPKKPPYPTLTIGDKNYQLLGIFKQNQQPFILVKGANTDLVKLKEGDEFSEGITLQKITTSAVIILQGETTIKFKLFERSDHG
ncbi:hypothetical protein [Pseudoalteromonas sp. S558]|uniref:hypothetical protein n=1 Tax=Pseudoalteromonas sp. S558 TaxID=2066515 RepID=UPI00110B9FD7|nr:hypothetical protein [Pseudoalteromonas sp. S558]TMO04188.1 hypothetical protein CWB66_09120 [Pseudoalteromonas sp. S558]